MEAGGSEVEGQLYLHKEVEGQVGPREILSHKKTKKSNVTWFGMKPPTPIPDSSRTIVNNQTFISVVLQ